MRAIKFRAWHKERKLMRYPYGIIVERHVYVYNAGIETWGFEEIELMQFTGLLDKNGKEVYEGDIVEDVLRIPGLPDTSRRWEVFWREDFTGFYLKMIGDERYEKHLWIDRLCGGNVEEFVVIGNIYEHPDLLKV